MSAVATGPVSGLLLAAGAGRRAGGPKALRRDPDGTSWLLRSVDVLSAGGCDRVVVVLGAEADRARALLATGGRDRIRAVVAARWSVGLSESLRVGLAASPPGQAVMIHLVDLPDVSAEVVRRLLAWRNAAPSPGALVRAAYRGTPGHPVLIGPAHRTALLDTLTGDRGAGAYLASHGVHLVECGDLGSGFDQDH